MRSACVPNPADLCVATSRQLPEVHLPSNNVVVTAARDDNMVRANGVAAHGALVAAAW
jgi:hypothetical protein